ncbi:uncharacterized protein LOC132284492 [Cornus florida]|uniref:uncharacterized protein LOC132284492 n=1 Tax=Cornus florida TaxID=4283 RepID=UPI00289EE9A0|nr:uncharacterized protein LOC132284492 [Cornus florida]
MEDINNENNKKKRSRADSDLESPGSERIDSDESGFNSPEAKRIREDLLDILDDSDTVTDRDPAIQDLDSVIKSLEEEIMHQSPPPQPAVVVDDSAAVPQPDLGYLLEASDDELGLPPAISPSGEQTKNESMDVRPVSPAREYGFDEVMVMEDEIPSYDSFEWRIVDETREVNEFVTLGGLFDYPESFDFSEFPQPELSTL